MTATGKREGLPPEPFDTLNMTKSVEHDILPKMPADPSSEELPEAGVGAETEANRGKGAHSDVDAEPAKPAAQKTVTTTVTQLTGAAAGEIQQRDGPRGTNGSGVKPEEGTSSNSANSAQIEAYAATKAMLMRLIRVGAPCARELAIKASAGRGVVPYNPYPPAAPVVQPPPADCFWQEFECVRLTLCSAETRHEYEKHKVVMLGTMHFSASEEITESSRTALLLFDVDHRELLGVWKATRNIDGAIYWRVVRRLAPMGEAAFLTSRAGPIFPELPPNDTSAMARGEDARLVLRVLAEHVAANRGKEDASMAVANESKSPAPPAFAQSATAPPASVQAGSAQPESPRSALVPPAPDASKSAPLAKAPAPSPVAIMAGIPMVAPATSSPRHAATTTINNLAAPAPQAATTFNGHPRPALAASPPTADTTVPAPAGVPTIVFGAFYDSAIPVTDPVLDKAASTSDGRVGAAAAGASDRVPVQVARAAAAAASKASTPTVAALAAAAAGAPAASGTSAAAMALVPPRIAPPSASLVLARVIPPPPSGGAPPPPPPVYLPPVLMLQRQRQAAEAAAPAPPAGAPLAPAAVQATGIRGLQGGSVPQPGSVTPRASGAATASSLATGPDLHSGRRVTTQPSQLAPAPAPQPVPGPPVPAPQTQPASTAGPIPRAAVPMQPASALAPRPITPGVQPQSGSALTRPSFLAAVRASGPPPGPTAGGAAPPRPVAPQAAARPVIGQAAPPAPAAPQVAASRPAAPAVVPGPFVSASSQPPTWSALAPPPPPIQQQQQPSAPMPVEQLAEAQPARTASALSCPLCIERSGCWFLLGCQHLGPCEECCPTPEWVQTLYPVCMRCNKAVKAAQVLKARVS